MLVPLRGRHEGCPGWREGKIAQLPQIYRSPSRGADLQTPDLPLPLAACPAHTYGHNCSQTCSCFNGASCDPVHGQCHCGPGWMGSTCLEGKPPPPEEGIF